MRLLAIDKKSTLHKELKRIGVDNRAHDIFIKKSKNMIIKLEKISCAQANVLKQIALINGADCAIPKNAYSGSKRKKHDVLVFANHRELEKILERLAEQSWLQPITDQLQNLFKDKKSLYWKIKRKKISFNRTNIMGVINVTPDSFYQGSRYTSDDIVKRVVEGMEQEGADFIDIGAESSRPGSKPVDMKNEIKRLSRLLPVVTRATRLPISIDTYKAKVAQFAIDHGAKIVNDISGLGFDKKMPEIVAKNKAGLVIMHMKGKPRTMQKKPKYDDLMNEICQYFRERIDYALHHNIDEERIVIDPGLGFGKNLTDNYEILRRLQEFGIFNRPILAGHSRKSFIGKPFGLEPEQRLEGTLAFEALLIEKGTSIIRVHDVYEAKKVSLLIDKILK